jgi:hypothetical protein
MYEIEQTDYGMRLTLEGYIEPEEMKSYCEEGMELADQQDGSFGVVADLRKASAVPEDSQSEQQRLMQHCDKQGLERAAGVIESATTAIQIQRMAEQVNHADGKAVFIDATEVADWESAAVEWAKHGIEPESTW